MTPTPDILMPGVATKQQLVFFGALMLGAVSENVDFGMWFGDYINGIDRNADRACKVLSAAREDEEDAFVFWSYGALARNIVLLDDDNGLQEVLVNTEGMRWGLQTAIFFRYDPQQHLINVHKLAKKAMELK